MDSYQNYLDSIIDNTYKELKPLVDSYLAKTKCSECGGSVKNFKCIYCHRTIEDMDFLVSTIIKKIERLNDYLGNIEIEKIKNNKLFNLFCLLKDNGISEIDEILKKYNYEDEFNNVFNGTVKKLRNFEKLNDLEIDTVETYIKRNTNRKNIDSLHAYFIGNAITKENQISYECFKILIKNFVENHIQMYYPDNGVCIIIPSEDIPTKIKSQKILGHSTFNKTYIAEELVNNLYYNGSTSFLGVFYHELTHTAQYKNALYGSHINAFILNEIRDYILANELDSYYEENYDNVLFELEANFYEIDATMKFLESLGFKIDKTRYIKEMGLIKAKMENNTRYVNGEEITLDNLFEKFIVDKPEFLEKHTQLTYIYKILDNKVYPKTEEELLNDYNTIVDNPNCSADDKEFYKTFYSHFISYGRK